MKVSSLLILLGLISEQGLAASSKDAVVVYSARKEHLIKPVFDQFTKETGIKVQYTTDKAPALLQKLKAEGKRTKADLLMTVDAANLYLAGQEGVLRPVSSKVLQNNIPEKYRDKNGLWYGLSVRARTIVYATDRVKPADLATYEVLGDKKWHKRLCLRTSKKVYNQSLVAMFISDYGEVKTENIIKSWVGNLATNVFPNDTSVMKAIIAGQCDVGIVNTYYFGRLLKKEPQTKLALFWPNQKTSGVHVNISGAGVTKFAKHPNKAIQLLEWLSSEKAQDLFAGLNMEYPANPKVEPVDMVKAWGKFKSNTINVAKAGELQPVAIKLMDRANYK